MNYYEILNIDANSSTRQIKKHYYNLAKKYHPDKNLNKKENTEKFKLLSEAYSTLSNPRKRYLYDLKLKFNIKEDTSNLNFTDEDYKLLHEYYNKIMNFTEIKFLKLLFNSLPDMIKIKLKTKLNNLFQRYSSETITTTTLIHITNIRYIHITDLKGIYTVNLFRKFKDIYNNIPKQLIVLNNNRSFHFLVTSYNYSLIINEKEKKLILNIIGKTNNFRIQNYDLIFTKNINLYQYFYGDNYSILLDSARINFTNKYNYSQKISNRGLLNYKNGKRGNLCINYTVDLNKHNLYNNYEENKKIISNLFNIA